MRAHPPDPRSAAGGEVSPCRKFACTRSNWQFLLTQVRSESETVRLTAHGLGSAAGLRSKIAKTLGSAKARAGTKALVTLLRVGSFRFFDVVDG